MQTSDWASQIITVLIPDKVSVRVCNGFKQTVNPVSTFDKYPIPKVDDLFSTLSGGKVFSKIDLNQAYQQLLGKRLIHECCEDLVHLELL